MIELRKSPVAFDEESHRYSLGPKRLSGITSLIHDVVGLGVYPGASEYVRTFFIPRAAEYGTSVHKSIESYDRYGLTVTLHPKSQKYQDGLDDRYWDVSKELANYVRHRQGFSPLANEYTVSDNERYASQIDNVWVSDSTGGIYLADTKTNNLDLYPGKEPALVEYLSWQLSCYAVLFEQQNPGLKVEGLIGNWFRKGQSRQWAIERRSDDEVRKLLATPWVEIDGRIIYDIGAYQGAQSEAIVENKAPALVRPEVVDAICDLVRQQKEAEEKVAELKAKLREAMENAGVKSWDSGRFKATIAADSTSTTFDARRFKADYPDLYKQYSKTAPKKGGFTITLREE